MYIVQTSKRIWLSHSKGFLFFTIFINDEDILQLLLAHGTNPWHTHVAQKINWGVSSTLAANVKLISY